LFASSFLYKFTVLGVRRNEVSRTQIVRALPLATRERQTAEATENKQEAHKLDAQEDAAATKKEEERRRKRN
jgi:hypothetical protein